MAREQSAADLLAYRRQRAWYWRSRGLSIYRIQERLAEEGIVISPPTVAEYLKHTLAELAVLEERDAKEWRDNELAVLATVIESQTAIATDPTDRRAPDAANAVTRAMELRARLLGIEAPKDVNFHGQISFQDMLRQAEQWANHYAKADQDKSQ